MASPELSRRVEKVVGYPPLCEMDHRQRRERESAGTACSGLTWPVPDDYVNRSA
jgi:hypothetical protein